MTTGLVFDASEMGLWRRNVNRRELIHHSDKGSSHRGPSLTEYALPG